MGTTKPEDLIRSAQSVLSSNRSGQSTKPSPDLYPHQWFWDSCFIAIGVSRYDAERAQLELRALTRGQWANGMVPQIIFNPESQGYFPGPETWQSSCSPQAPSNLETSGITQPPVFATAVHRAMMHDPDRERGLAFARELYTQVVAYHRFLYRERDPDQTGLIVVLHPWESGLDNNPAYLVAGSRVHLTYTPKYTRLDTKHVAAANRPTNKDYDLFVWLLEQMRAVEYDWNRYIPTAALQVEDVLFNSILVRANEDLANLAEAIGEDPTEAREWREKTATAIESKLWSEEAGTYFSYDRIAKEHLREETVVGFMPLFAGTPGAGRKERLLEHLRDESRFRPAEGFMCPTTGMNSSWFNPENYWLGPVWVNTNWLLVQALRRHQEVELAASLAAGTVELIERNGFREYFNPFTGEGYGTDGFSWSAALTVDLLSQEG